MAKRCLNPFTSRSAVVSMVFMGLLLVLVGVWNNEISLLFKDTNITPFALIIISVVSFVLVMLELGIKRYSDLSNLAEFGNQQLLSFIVACLVVISSIAVTFNPQLEWLTWFNGGTFVMQGLSVILEAFR